MIVGAEWPLTRQNERRCGSDAHRGPRVRGRTQQQVRSAREPDRQLQGGEQSRPILLEEQLAVVEMGDRLGEGET